jgi:micrococcal nuclease
MKRAAFIVIIILLLPGAIVCRSASVLWINVKWVLDGDTVVLSDGRHVRYIGINTPEVEHDQTPAEPFGIEAQALNRRLVLNQRIRIELDVEKKDQYGRWLAYVIREDGLLVNQAMVREGLGHVLRINPNTRQAPILLEAQRIAMSARKGMWRFLAEGGKGPFIGSRQSMRFHSPNCPEGRKISSRNRIVFDRAWDAFWQGYAPAKGCIAGVAALLDINGAEIRSNDQ